MGQCSPCRTVCSQKDFSNEVVLEAEVAESLDRFLSSTKSLSSRASAGRVHRARGGRRLGDDYDVDRTVLGRGLCGRVVLAYGRADGRKYAVKSLTKRGAQPDQLQQMAVEVGIHLALDHPNVARLHGAFESEHEVELVMECCQGGELFQRLTETGVFPDAEATEATRQMLRATDHLHSLSVVHRDLKPENFLYKRKEMDGKDFCLKLIDFGFATVWDDPKQPMTVPCGSIPYISPDVLSEGGYTDKCDLWSLGIIVWLLLVGYTPFVGDGRTALARIRTGAPDWRCRNRWDVVAEDAVNFVKKLLDKDPERRLSAREA